MTIYHSFTRHIRTHPLIKAGDVYKDKWPPLFFINPIECIFPCGAWSCACTIHAAYSRHCTLEPVRALDFFSISLSKPLNMSILYPSPLADADVLFKTDNRGGYNYTVFEKLNPSEVRK